uniref:Uncharacterized protein n=1 Tax=Rhizophora mucronata TaxID=61149 RepID=A0A2P2QKK6_RHIMU
MDFSSDCIVGIFCKLIRDLSAGQLHKHYTRGLSSTAPPLTKVSLR